MSVRNIAPIDENVKVPAAVRAQAKRSEDLVNRINAGQAPFGEQPAPAVEVLAAPAADPPQPALTAEPAAEPAAELPADPQEEDTGNWENRYNSMKGRFTRAIEQNKSLSDRIGHLENMISTLQTAPPAAPSPAATPKFDLEKLLTDDEVRDYGPDFLEVVGKKAREAMAPVIKGYEDKIATMENQLKGVSKVVTQDAKDKMHEFLDKKIPDWQQINFDPAFISWLSLPDTFSGAIRQGMLNSAYAQGDAPRVAAFFNGFLTEEATVRPATPGTTSPVTPKIPLASLAAPGRAKSAASTELPAEKPVFTRAQITSFYSEVAAGKYRGRDADKNKREAEIFSASREGRIR